MTAKHAGSGVPTWLAGVLTAYIFWHLGSVILISLDAPSGPWPHPQMGAVPGFPPMFVRNLHGEVGNPYLSVCKLAHPARFLTNSPGMIPATRLEFVIKTESGEERTIHLPDPKASRRTQAWQELVVARLADDRPLAPIGEKVAGPGQKDTNETYWEDVKNELVLVTKPKHLRNTMVMTPSDACLTYTKAYARYLARTENAKSVVIKRFWYEPYPPMVLFQDDMQANMFHERKSNFGEITK